MIMKYSTFLKISITVYTVFFVNLIQAQWAGSSSPAGSSTQTRAVKTNSIAGKSYAGIEYGGFTRDYLEWYSYENAPSGQGYVTSTNYGSTAGAGIFLGKMISTKLKPLSVGFEMNGAYYSQKVSYDYYNVFSQTINSSTGDMNVTYIGAGIPVRISLVNQQKFNVYLQGNLGVGYIDVIDDHDISLMYGAEGIVYGGGSMGLRISSVFFELGINSDSGNGETMGLIRGGLVW